MARTLFAVALAAAAAACAVAYPAMDPRMHQPRGGAGDQGEAAPAPAPETEAQRAQDALAEAESTHEDAVKHVAQALRQLEDFTRQVGQGTGLKETAYAVEQGAARAVSEDASEAQQSFQKSMSELSQAAGDEAPLDRLEDSAKQAARRVAAAGHRQAKEMRRILAQMRQEKKDQSRDLVITAKQAAHVAVRTAQSLERAQRRAGLSERKYEGEYDQNERIGEEMQGRAERAGDEAEDKIERFFGRVEGLVERRADSVADEAERHHEALSRSVHEAREKARRERAERAKAAKAAEEERATVGEKEEQAKAGKEDERAKAGKEEEPAKAGKEEEPTKAGKEEEPAKAGKEEEAHEASPKTSLVASGSGDQAASGDERVAEGSLEAAAPAKPTILAAAAQVQAASVLLVAAAAGVVSFGIAVRERRAVIREPPLLG